ncbi:unnamed protein product, partial [Closterium sp. NIES-53]
AEPVPKPLPPAQSPRLRQRTQAGSAAFAAAAGAAAVAAAARGGQGAATNGRPGSGGPGRSPMQLPVQKNKLSKYFPGFMHSTLSPFLSIHISTILHPQSLWLLVPRRSSNHHEARL